MSFSTTRELFQYPAISWWCHILSDVEKFWRCKIGLLNNNAVMIVDKCLSCLEWGGLLTHLALDKMATILQTTFSDAFSWMKSFVLWLKFHWSLFVRVQLTITQHCLDNGLAPNRPQAIILTNYDIIQWCIYVALGDVLMYLVQAMYTVKYLI